MKGTGRGSFRITISMMRCWMRMVGQDRGGEGNQPEKQLDSTKSCTVKLN